MADTGRFSFKAFVCKQHTTAYQSSARLNCSQTPPCRYDVWSHWNDRLIWMLRYAECHWLEFSGFVPVTVPANYLLSHVFSPNLSCPSDFESHRRWSFVDNVKLCKLGLLKTWNVAQNLKLNLSQRREIWESCLLPLPLPSVELMHSLARNEWRSERNKINRPIQAKRKIIRNIAQTQDRELDLKTREPWNEPSSGLRVRFPTPERQGRLVVAKKSTWHFKLDKTKPVSHQ